MNNRYIHVFTDADLDGVVSYLTLSWFLNLEPPVTVTTEKELAATYKSFSQNNHIENFTRIYILDLDICSLAQIVDKSNFSIVDHHMGSVNCGYTFKNARYKIEKEGSTCKMLYNLLKNHYKRDLDNNKKLLISIGHDYDSYTLSNKDVSIGLNTLFWNYQGNRLEKFVNRFREGFNGFTNEEKRIIAFYNNKVDRYILESNIFTGNVAIGANEYKISSIMADFCINEISQQMIDKTCSDIGIVVNSNSNSVSFRRKKGCTVNLSKLAEKLCEGGGHEAAAGGKITPVFLEFTKLLK